MVEGNLGWSATSTCQLNAKKAIFSFVENSSLVWIYIVAAAGSLRNQSFARLV